MLPSLNKPGVRSLVLNLLIAVGAVMAMNGLVFGFGWNRSNDNLPKLSFEPPDYVIGIVWIVLFALMATARWLLNSYFDTEASQARDWVTFLLIFCLIWPLYSLAISSVIGGLVGNMGTIAIAVIAVTRAWMVSKTAALLIMPVIPWVIFATATIFLDGAIRL